MGKTRQPDYILKRVKFNGKFKTTEDWKSSAILVVSVENMHFRNKQSLEQILAWITSKTKSFDVLIGDHLHRLNNIMFVGMPKMEAIDFAYSKADELIDILEKTSEELGISSYRIIRSREIYENDRFKEYYDYLFGLYVSDPFVKEGIEMIVEMFLKRKKSFAVPRDLALKLCVQYLLEELVIFQILGEQGKSINVYPGRWSVFKSIVNDKVVGIPKELTDYQLVELNFVKTR